MSPLFSQMMALSSEEIIENLTLKQLTCYVCLAGQLKRNILLAAAVNNSDPDLSPPVLSQGITAFLSAAVGISKAEVDVLWSVFREEIWENPHISATLDKDLELFQQYGWKLGISELLLFISFQYF